MVMFGNEITKRRGSIPPLAASIKITNIRLAGNSDHGLLVAILGVG